MPPILPTPASRSSDTNIGALHPGDLRIGRQRGLLGPEIAGEGSARKRVTARGRGCPRWCSLGVPFTTSAGAEARSGEKTLAQLGDTKNRIHRAVRKC